MTTKKILLFDLGGVLININYQATIDAFEKLGIENFKDMYSQANQSGLFDDYETGKISSFAFVNGILDVLPQGCTANQVVHAWNAMLLDWPKERLAFLQNLAKTHDLYVLSNTNDLHMEQARRNLAKSTDLQLEDYFTKVFLSQELGDRKPNVSIFQKVADQIGVKPEEIFFVDDSIQHVESALSLGMEAVHLTQDITTHPSLS